MYIFFQVGKFLPNLLHLKVSSLLKISYIHIKFTLASVRGIIYCWQVLKHIYVNIVSILVTQSMIENRKHQHLLGAY